MDILFQIPYYTILDVCFRVGYSMHHPPTTINIRLIIVGHIIFLVLTFPTNFYYRKVSPIET